MVIFTRIRESPWMGVLYANGDAVRAAFHTSAGPLISGCPSAGRNFPDCNTDLELLCEAWSENGTHEARTSMAQRRLRPYRWIHVFTVGRWPHVLHRESKDVSRCQRPQEHARRCRCGRLRPHSKGSDPND